MSVFKLRTALSREPLSTLLSFNTPNCTVCWKTRSPFYRDLGLWTPAEDLTEEVCNATQILKTVVG